jgi:heptosyltransferase III
VDVQILRRRVANHAMRWLFGEGRAVTADASPLPTEGVFRILVCRVTHSLGNTLLLTPLIRELQSTYPGAEVDILTRSLAATEIFGAFRCVRMILRLPAHGFRHPIQFVGGLLQMRRVHYDLVIDPCLRSQTGRLALLLAKGRFKLGFIGSGKNAAITHAIPKPIQTCHVGQLPVLLLRTALGKTALESYPTLGIGLTPAEREVGVATLADLTHNLPDARTKKGVIGIFANATGPKLLGSAWWRRFMAVLETHYVDYSIIEIVPVSGKSLLDSRYPAYYSSSIRKLAGVLSELAVFISADCGVLHLACASGTPAIGIFTVTDPAEWGPYGPSDRVIKAAGLSPEEAAQQVVG